MREAIEQAATIRLRPVMMTMICTVLGGLPLVLASGAGAEARIALGWVIVGGLGLATVSTLFLTPVAYLLLGRFVTPNVRGEEAAEARAGGSRLCGWSRRNRSGAHGRRMILPVAPRSSTRVRTDAASDSG